jgi:hypothetical protein
MACHAGVRCTVDIERRYGRRGARDDISAGFFDVYSELSAEFERTTGHRLVTTRDL